MTITLSSPIVGNGGTIAEALAAASGGQPITKDVIDYITELHRLCELVGFDFRILLAQAWHETDGFTSKWWNERLNPAGIGITGDPAQNAASHTWENGTDAARAHVVHMWGYTRSVPGHHRMLPAGIETYLGLDPRYDAIFDARYEHSVRVLGDLGNGKWATDPKYAQKIAAKANQIFTGGTAPMATKPSILVIAGHRSYGDAGNPVEKNMTDDLARAYKNAFRAAGYTCDWLQEIDGDTDPDDTAGGLDTVSAKAAAWLSGHGDSILFDCHFEGTDPSVRGCFAIIPDVIGLRTGAPVPQDANDTWENNTLDRDLARNLVNALTLATKLPQRTGVREQGLMDESQTGVGGQGFRLATFAYTSPQRMKAVRLVVEHGAHTNAEDRAIIQSPGFFDKCATAAVAAVNAVYGGVLPHPQPGKPIPGPITWKPGDTGIKELNGTKVYALLAEVTCVKPNGTQPHTAASSKSATYGKKIEKNQKIVVVGTLESGWILFDGGDGTYPRAARSGFRPLLPKPSQA